MSNYPEMWDRIVICLGTDKTGRIAEILDISDSLVSDWKGDRAFPTLIKLFEIADYGSTTVDWILKGNEPKNISVNVDNLSKSVNFYTRNILFEISKKTGQSLPDLMQQLIDDGLILRGHLMFHPKEELRNQELKIIHTTLKWYDNLPKEEDKESFALKIISLMVSSFKRKTFNLKDKPKAKGRSKKSETLIDAQHLGNIDEFNVEEAVQKHDTLDETLEAWYKSEGKEMPQGFSLNFDGWQKWSVEFKVVAVKQAREFADAMLEKFERGEFDDE